jgi:hypothetical protein
VADLRRAAAHRAAPTLVIIVIAIIVVRTRGLGRQHEHGDERRSRHQSFQHGLPPGLFRLGLQVTHAEQPLRAL